VRRSAVICLATVLRVVAADQAGWNDGLDVIVEGSAGLRGGAQRGTALHSMALARLEWRQATNADRTATHHFYASVLNLAGRGPTERYLGDFFAASNIEGYASTRLYSCWWETTLGDWSLRAGSLLADEEFATTEAGGALFNSAFGWPAFISANTANTGPAFCVPALGARFERTLGENAAWRLGVYDGDSFDSSSGDPVVARHGMHFRLGGSQGWFAISEAALSPGKSGNRFKVGAWLHTASFADLRDDAQGGRFAVTGADPRLHSRNYGAYGVAERTLAGKAGAAGYVTAYARIGVSPKDRNTIGYALDTGIAATGLIPGRDGDVTAFGLIHGAFSPRFAATARLTDPAAPSPDHEQVAEISHAFVISERFTLQPDLQYIRHPGGSTAQRDAVALLLRAKASF
jgi:porin